MPWPLSAKIKNSTFILSRMESHKRERSYCFNPFALWFNLITTEMSSLRPPLIICILWWIVCLCSPPTGLLVTFSLIWWGLSQLKILIFCGVAFIFPWLWFAFLILVSFFGVETLNLCALVYASVHPSLLSLRSPPLSYWVNCVVCGSCCRGSVVYIGGFFYLRVRGGPNSSWGDKG